MLNYAQDILIVANATGWQMKIKVFIPSLTPADVQELEEKGISSIEDIGWHDNESLAPWTM